MLIKEEYPLFKRWSPGVLTLLGAADDNLIVTSTNMKNGTYTIAAQPGVPSRISVTTTASGTADTQGIVTIVGTNDLDEVISEAVTPEAGSTVYTTLYFKTITSVTGSGWVIDAGAGNDTIIVGVSMECELLVHGQNIIMINVSGNIYINPVTVATANNGFPLAVGESVALAVREKLSIISDVSGGTFKFIIPEN